MEPITEADIEERCAIYDNQNGITVSIVLYKKNKTLCKKRQLVNSVNEASEIMKEIIAHVSLQHPNIIPCIGYYFECGQGNQINYVNILIPYYPEGSLEKLIRSHKDNNDYFKESQLLSYLDQLVSAFEYMQKQNICHRDIKPQNILVSDNSSTLIVCDLGSSAKKNYYDMISIQGTPCYLSPILKMEYMRRNFHNIKHEIYKSDVYSLGLTFLYLASLKPVSDMYDTVDLQELELDIISRIDGLNGYKTLKNILRKMLNFDESARPDFIQLKSMISQPLLTLEDPSVINGFIYLSNFTAKCYFCNTEKEEDKLFCLESSLVCSLCYSNAINPCGNYFLIYNNRTYEFSNFINDQLQFSLCSWCKFYHENKKESCLNNFLLTRSYQTACWVCRMCRDRYMYRNTASYFISCENDHHFCLICENEYNNGNHNLCRQIYSLSYPVLD